MLLVSETDRVVNQRAACSWLLKPRARKSIILATAFVLSAFAYIALAFAEARGRFQMMRSRKWAA